MRSHDHIGWTFAGDAGFEELACPFLAEGAARGELLMYLAAVPRPATAARLRDRYGSRVIRISRVTDVYGESGIVDSLGQRAVFATVLADALAAGFAGIRVATDATPLVASEAGLAAWIRWEHVADRFMADNPVTGLCAFDVRRVDMSRLRRVAALHPLSAVTDPEPRYRMYSDGGALCLQGHVGSDAVRQLPLAMEALPPGTGVLIDLSAATLTSRTPLAGLRRLAASGVPVTIRGERAALDTLAGNGLRPGKNLLLEATGAVASPSPATTPSA
ncbi:MAG: MEDS domain-containing protein [Nocardiopsaceae bacterium]|nr:MEDS domain-containing protein [Nocardiopsaceae bacterium]